MYSSEAPRFSSVPVSLRASWSEVRFSMLSNEMRVPSPSRTPRFRSPPRSTLVRPVAPVKRAASVASPSWSGMARVRTSSSRASNPRE